MPSETEEKILTLLVQVRERVDDAVSDKLQTRELIRDLSDTFLRHDAEDKARHSELLAAFEIHKTSVTGEIRGLSLLVGELEKDQGKIESRVEQSGAWHVEGLREKAAQERIEATSLRDKALTFALGLLSAAIVALVGYLVVSLQRPTLPPPTSPPITSRQQQ